METNIAIIDSRRGNPENRFDGYKFINISNEGAERFIVNKSLSGNADENISVLLKKYNEEVKFSALSVDLACGQINKDFIGLGIVIYAIKSGMHVIPYLRDRQLPANSMKCLDGIILGQTGRSIVLLPSQYEPPIFHSAEPGMANLKLFFEPIVKEYEALTQLAKV